MGYKPPRKYSSGGIAALLTCSMIVFSVGTLNVGPLHVRTAEASDLDPCDTALPVRKVTSSLSSTTPYNAIDSNFATSWNSQGKGSWIKPDLGAKQTICYVDIDWLNGGSREYNFAISVSNDGSTWKIVYSGESSGTTTSFQRYNFDNVDARWVKVTVNGNQYDMTASIQELRAYGHEVGAASPEPTEPEPTPEPTPTPTQTDNTKYDPNTFIDSVTNDLGQTVVNGAVTKSSKLNLYYRGTDNVGVAFFEGSLDGGSWSKIATPSPLSITVSSEGLHSYKLRAVDNGGRVDKTPAQFSWTYDLPELIADTTPPSLTIKAPTDGQSFPAGTKSITVSGTASDNVAVSLIEGSLNGGSFVLFSGTTTWSYSAGGLVDGQSYSIDVRAKDAAGNTQTASVSFSVQSPPPAPAGENQKMLKATLNTWSNENMQYDIFNPYLDSDSDRVRLHVSLNHDITAEEYSLTERLPSKIKGMEFFSLAEIRAHAPILAQRGYDYCDYDIEPGDGHTPQAEFDDFVNSIRTASVICHNAGLDMHCSPANWRLRQGDTIEQVAPLCDELHFQFQVVQEEPSRYLSYAEQYAERARAANPDITLTIQLSTQQPAAPGMSLLETFKLDWTNVKPHVDGVSIWWANNDTDIATMEQFMAWFNGNGRS